MNAVEKVLYDNFLNFGRSRASGSSVFLGEANGEPMILGHQNAISIRERIRGEVLFMLKKFRRTMLPEPSTIDLGDEVNLVWELSEGAAHVSIDGSGRFGYAMKFDGVFVPGNGSEDIYASRVPQDLFKYLDQRQAD